MVQHLSLGVFPKELEARCNCRVWHRTVVLIFYPASELPEGLDKTQTAGLTSRISDLVGLGQGLRTCFSPRFPGDADAAGWGITL